MAKSKNVKDNKKEVSKKRGINKKIDSMETSASSEFLKLFRVLFAVLVVLGAFYLLTVVIIDNDSEEETEETTIQYEEILAGSSFNMRDKEYLVVYYDFTNSELTDITSQIYSYSYAGEYRLYMVDMSSGFNKPYMTEEKSNKSPKVAGDLLINGPTLIKFEDGRVKDYIEGLDKIVDYLK